MLLTHMLLCIFSRRGILLGYRFLANVLGIISIPAHVNQPKSFSELLAFRSLSV